MKADVPIPVLAKFESKGGGVVVPDLRRLVAIVYEFGKPVGLAIEGMQGVLMTDETLDDVIKKINDAFAQHCR